MYIAMSLVILAYVFHEFLSSKGLIKSFKLSTGVINTALFGLLAGVIGGATNAMSTILMMYLLSASDDKNTIAKVGNMCYFLGKVAQIIVLREPIMALSSGEWQLITLLSVLSIAALLVGIRLRRYLPQARFRQLILLILIVLGIRVGWQGITALL